MMKSTQWLRVVITSLVSLSAMAGCGGAEETPGGAGGSGGGATGGSGGGGGSSAMGVRLQPPKSYTILTSAEAAMGAAPAPAKYASACTACHQGQGQGFAQLAPETRHTPAAYAQWIVRNGRAGTGMTAFPAVADPNNPNAPITDAELTEIITWLNGLPKPADGAGLYHDFCGNCHGPVDPVGGAVPVNVKGLATQTYNDAVRKGFGTNPGLRDEYMPAFDAIALTDAELGLIRTFLGAI